MGYVIATANMKGGVGKTTLTVNLATCLAKNHNKRVLVVDLDTQISATLSLLSPADFAKLRAEKRTLKHLLNRSIKPEASTSLPIQDIIRSYMCTVKGLDLLPGDIDLYDEFLVSEMLHEKAAKESEHSFEQVWDRFEKSLVRSILQPVIKDYDFILLDCAPGYNLITRSGIIASDFYLLPAKPEPLSMVGIQLLERRINALREKYQSTHPIDVQLLGIVFTMSGGMMVKRYYREVMHRVTEDFSASKIFETRIPTDVNVSKAVDSYMPVVLSSPMSSGSKAFIGLTQEFLQKLSMIVGLKSQTTKMSLINLE